VNDALPHCDPPAPPALLRRKGAAALCDMGVSTFDRADAAGIIPAGRKVGGCKLWAVAELRAWAAHGCPPRAEWSAIWDTIRRKNTEPHS
jgi:hypothetical protein